MNQAQFESLPISEQLALVNATSADGDHRYFQWFCQIHDPKKSKLKAAQQDDTLINALEEQVIEEDFLDRLELIPAKTYPNEYAQILRLLARIDGQEAALSKKERGFLQNLAFVMAAQPNNLEILDNGCKVVGLLASVSPVARQGIREAIAESGLIGEIANILDLHPRNKNLIMSACRALNNAVYIHVAGKLAFLQSGGFVNLIQLFETDLDINAKRDAAMLLRAIVHLGDERLCLFDPGVPKSKSPLQDIVNVIESTTDSIVHLHAIWAALNITINMGDAKKAFGKVGGIAAITKSLQKNKDNIDLEHAACIAFQQMATKSFNRIAIGEGEAINEIISIMTKHKGDLDILNSTLGILERICVQASCRKRLSSPQILSVILSTFNYYKTNPEAMFLALPICYHLAYYTNSTKRALKEHGILEFLSSLTNIHSNQPQICSSAKEVSTLVLTPAQIDNEDSISTESSSVDSEDDGYDTGDFDPIEVLEDTSAIKKTNESFQNEIKRCNDLIIQNKELKKKYSQQAAKLKEQLQNNKNELLFLSLTKENEILQKTLDDESSRINQLDQELLRAKQTQKQLKHEIDQLQQKRHQTKQQHQIEVEKLILKENENEKKIKENSNILLKKEQNLKKLEDATNLINSTKQKMAEWMAIAIKLDQMSATDTAIDFEKEVIEKVILQNIDRALS